ncbi:MULTISPECIES: YagK/YfjJ domain-containing protein [Shewanella]|uniref:YagK/YfjJ domain-containing protein n=1 Tax=Shewanella TaxID=22 RepID=UPI001376C68E|nr:MULTISPECIES: inovirus-type Gp2 protein [Shewanella]
MAGIWRLSNHWFVTRLNIIYGASMKYVCKKSSFKYGDCIIEIPNGSLGWCRDIMFSALNQIEALLSVTSRVFIIRFDSHVSGYSQDNAQISIFRRRLIKSLRRRYPDLLFGYIWVREQEKAKQQHYHFAFIVDAERVPSASVVLDAAIKAWERLTGIHPHVPKHPYYIVKRGDEQSFIEAAGRISYLAKSRGKGYRPDQTKDYGTSRFKMKAANDSRF